MFELFADYLKSTGVADEQIIKVNLEDIAYEDLQSYKTLYSYVKERLCKDKYSYVFLDEIQNCKGYEKAVDSLFIQPNVDVYITGSNAYMLSGELATLLSGRYITIDMLPLSFKEYCTAVESVKTLREHFNDYLRFGSFPYVSMLEHTDAIVTPYIDGIYNTILIKDVAKREGITDVSLLESIVKFVASSMEGITYYQVSATVLDETTLNRELEPLQKIPDHHPKVLLTLDEIGAGTNYDGIKQLNLLDWLLG